MNKHFRQWKLLFHDDQNDATIREIQDDLSWKLDLLGKTRLDLLQDWVKLIYEDMFIVQDDGRYSLKESIGCFDKKDVEIVVTVPPGRSVLAHDQVHEAFIQEPIGKGQVFLVSEPEAMFRSWIQSGADPQDFKKVGGRYMVVDGGGGTCCIVRFRLERLEPSLGFEQEYESESFVCGAESISNLVEEKIGRKIALDVPNRVWVLDQFRRQFDDYFKRRFGADDEQTYNFEVSNLVCELSRQEIAECFDTCIAKLFKAMDRHLKRGLPVHFLVLGGGLFASPYVQKAVDKHFNTFKICQLSKDKGHVAQGAVLVRTCAPFIIRRPILRSKAVTTFVEVTDAIKRSPIFEDLYIKKDKFLGEQWCFAAQWLAKQGTEAKIKHANDMYEVASEASFKDARKRFFDLSEEDLTFSETMLTFNHIPPVNQELLFQLKDETWVTMDGNPIPQPENSEKLTWDPEKIGINLNTLEISCDRSKNKPFRVLRYAIQMQMREVGTKYWVKTWSWTKPAKTKGRVQQILLSEADECQALFTPQEISRNLAASYDLGPGMRKEAGNEDGESRRAHQHDKGAKDPSTAHSLANQALHVESSSRIASTIVVDQAPHGNHTSAPSSSFRHDLLSAQWDFSQYRQQSHSPLRTVRPSQRQSIEGNAEYSIGAPRNNGGCWTCKFRNVKCDILTPKCNECASLGLICEYGRPTWWYDDDLKQVQKETNKHLIKEHKALLALGRQSLDRTRQVGLPRIASNPKTGLRPQATQSAPAQNYSGSQNPPIADPQALVPRKAYVPKAKTPLPPRKPSPVYDDYDIYDDLPPSPKRARMFSTPSTVTSIGEEGMGIDDSWIRRSTRQREPTTQPVDMVKWDDINSDEFGVESDTAESE